MRKEDMLKTIHEGLKLRYFRNDKYDDDNDNN